MSQPIPDWDDLSLQLANSPNSFQKWAALTNASIQGLTKASTSDQIDRFRLTFDQLLLKFPYLERYWCDYASLEFRIGYTERAKAVYLRALSVLPHSNLVWCEFLEFVKLTELNYEKVLKWFVNAEGKIGMHYHSYEFWRMFLEFEESHHGRTTYWFNLLRKVLEVPSYNYAYFFKLMFAEIDQIQDVETVYKIVDNVEMKKKLKIDGAVVQWKKETFHDVRAKLKKTFTDAYITTQFSSFELYQFEKNVKLEYFVPEKYQSYQDLVNWDEYLSFMELNGSPSQIKQLYHRALVPTANYTNIWMKFADYYIHQGKLQSARNLLYSALGFMSSGNIVVIQLKLIKVELALENYIRARDMILGCLEANDENVELLIQLLNVEYLLALRRDEADDEQFKQFTVALLDGKSPEVSVCLLRHVAGYKALKINMTELLDELKPQLEKCVQFWLLLLSLVESEDQPRVYEQAVAAIGESPRLVRWYADHMASRASCDELRVHFLRSVDAL